MPIATLSKYPPYISGHSSQALWNNRAMADLLGQPVHQVTADGPPPDWTQDSRVEVHQVALTGNRKVRDGTLVTSMAAALYRLHRDRGVDRMLALYADPHASALARAVAAVRANGGNVRSVVSIEGSDLTDSLVSHLEDGLGAVLLGDILAADAVLAVSKWVREGVLSAAAAAAEPQAEALAAHCVVRYPGLPRSSFRPAPQAEQLRWRKRVGLPAEATVVSTHVRLVPEKGAETLIGMADAADRGPEDVMFVVAGRGPQAPALLAASQSRDNLVVIDQPDGRQAHLLRSTSSLGVFPSRPTRQWTETFGIAGLEYQALGVPVLASDSGGLRESVAEADWLIPVNSSAQHWWAQAKTAIEERARRGERAARFASDFTAASSARQILDIFQS